jgi:hypothetical protein
MMDRLEAEKNGLKELINTGAWETKKIEMAAWAITPELKNYPNGIRGIEIGVHQGANAYMLLTECSNIGKLTAIDPFLPYYDVDHFVGQEYVESNYLATLENLSTFGDRCEVIRARSIDTNNRFDDESMDFVFIDGDHSIRGLLADLIAYEPKVKKGGIVAGHDYWIEDVRIALQAWVNMNKMDANTIKFADNSCWYWTKT